MRVVVADDERDLLLLCALNLRLAGMDVVEAADGREALARVREQAPDILLLDVMLPHVDGFAVLDALLAEHGTLPFPVVFVSARVGVEDQRRALESGAVAYVRKPFDPPDLVALVRELAASGPEDWQQRRREALARLAVRAAERRAPVAAPPQLPDQAAGPPASVLDLALDAIVSVDDRQRIVAFNRGAELVFGYLAEEVLGKPLDLLLPARVAPAHQGHVAQFASAPQAARLMGERREIFGRRKDGTEFPAEASIVKTNIAGQPTFSAILRDVTERRRAEQELRSRARQQAAVAELGQRALSGIDVETLMDEVVVVLAAVLDVEFAEVLELARDGERLVLRAAVGWPRELIGETAEDSTTTAARFALDDDEPNVVEDFATETRFRISERAREHGVRSGMSVAIRGTTRPFGVLAVHQRTPRRFVTDDIHFLRSVANVLAAAVERERTEERLRAFLEAAPDATLVVDAGGRIVSANAQTEALFGYSREELVGTPVDLLVPEHVRARHAQHRAAYSTAPRTRPMGAGVSLSARCKDGTEVPVDIMLSPLETDEGPLIVAAVRDVTERRRAEAVRESFLHAVSHELRTPLTAVLGFASMLADGVADDELADDLHARILANAHKLDRLLSDLLDLDRLSRGVTQPLRRRTELAALASAIVASFAAPDRPIDVAIDEGLVADVDPAQVERVLENLLANVARHTPSGTRVLVAAQRGPNGVLLRVEDDGPGVPDDLKERIFEPFSRGVASGHVAGTGIGLSLVARFAELHGGRAWVEDRPGGGAAFRVLLGEASNRHTPAFAVAAGDR